MMLWRRQQLLLPTAAMAMAMVAAELRFCDCGNKKKICKCLSISHFAPFFITSLCTVAILLLSAVFSVHRAFVWRVFYMVVVKAFVFLCGSVCFCVTEGRGGREGVSFTWIAVILLLFFLAVFLYVLQWLEKKVFGVFVAFECA